jgi:electron transfer flavoprotein alpha subunit
VLVEGATPREQAAALYEGYLRERLASNRPRTPERRTDTAVLATGMGSEGRAPRIFAVVDATGAGADPGRQARALAGFLRRGLGGVSAEARAAVRTLLICSGQADAEQLAAEAPTRLVHVLRVSGRDAGDVGRALIRRADNGGDVLFVLPPGPVGARLAARLALAHGGSAVSGVLDATFDAEGRLQAHARVFSGHLVGRLALAASPWCLAVDSFWQDEPAAPFAAHEVVEESLITPAGPEGHTPWLDELTLAPGPASDDLAGAGLLLAVGQGAGGRDGVSRLAAVAARIGAAFGASRPVVMNAWAPMDRLVGVSGTRTAPDVCIAAGASGAPAFLWGIERAGFLVAVNTDPQAPLLRAADVAVVGDAVAVSEALAEVMAADREAS